MNTKEKHPLYEELKQYLKINHLVIADAKSWRGSAINVEKESGKPQNEYYLNRYFEEKENNVWGIKILPGFIQYLMGKIDHKKLVSFISSRLPAEDKYGNNYLDHTKPLFATLAKNQELLYTFVARKSFLTKHFEDIPSIINLFELPRLKEALFAEMISHKEIHSVKSQNLFYQLINKHSKHPKKYYPLLNLLKLGEEQEEKSYFSFSEKKSCLINFDLLELNSQSNNKYKDLGDLQQICKNFLLEIMQQKEILGIDFYQERDKDLDNSKSYNKKSIERKNYRITLVGDNPNMKIIEKLLNDFVKKAFTFEDAYTTSGIKIEKEFIEKLILEEQMIHQLSENKTRKIQKI